MDINSPYRSNTTRGQIAHYSSANNTESGAESTYTKRHATNHDITMFSMSGSGKTLGQRISNHEMRTKRLKFHDGMVAKVRLLFYV